MSEIDPLLAAVEALTKPDEARDLWCMICDRGAEGCNHSHPMDTKLSERPKR